MFNLELNTTDNFYHFIIDNDLAEKVNNNHEGIIYYSFESMFSWRRSPEGETFWIDRIIDLNLYKRQNISNFKFLQ